MVPVLSELLVGVAANGLYEVLRRAVRTGSPGQLATATKAVEQALASVDELPDQLQALPANDIERFLSSPEVHYLVRQVYASADLAATEPGIKQEFWRLWLLKSSSKEVDLQSAVGLLFDSLVSLCERALDSAIATGDLSALDAKNARQHRYLRDAVLGIERALEALSNAESLDPSAIDTFADQYRRQVAKREGVIVPPALDAARDFPIDALYVPPRLAPPREGVDDLDYQQFSSELYRSVVLGNPGSGKSTLAKKLTADIATDKVHLPTVPLGAVPFLVVLRDYGARKKESPCSILDFLIETSNSRYQIPSPNGAIEYLLATNRSVVIFDGLDELLDTTYRAEISADVQSFATLYPSVPLLVTSREVGYDQAPLPSSTFPTYRLSEFTDEDVNAYARRWFAVGQGIAAKDAKANADRFMADSKSVADLRSNALMLGLMCNLYKGSGYIPRNRPDVYEACADMLFDRWDRLRQIQVGLNIESHIKTSMQHLAFWIYQDPELQSGVTEDALIQEASEYLLGRRFDTREEAEEEARKFIEFCRGRAWVFTDTGTTPAGSRLYQFTHRTFLEFFAARHLVRTNPTPESLLKVLMPHISAQEWDVVAQLSFQILEKNVEGAADALLNALLPTNPDPHDVAQANRLDFSVRSLAFLVPSPLTTRRLADAGLEMAMSWAMACSAPERGDWVSVDPEINPVETVLELLTANVENRSPIRSSLESGLKRFLHEDKSSAIAAELGLNLHRAGEDQGPLTIGSEVEGMLLEHELDQLREVAAQFSGIACDLVIREKYSVSELIANHGLDPLFTHRFYWLFPRSGRVPLSGLIFGTIIWGATAGLSLQHALSTLPGIAQALETAGPPWYEVSNTFAGSTWAFNPYRRGAAERLTDVEELDSPSRFALIAIAAAAAEEAQALEEMRGSAPGMKDLMERLTDDESGWSVIAPIFRARLGMAPIEEGKRVLSELGLPSRGMQLLEAWLDASTSLVSVSSSVLKDEN
jgi:NACHT domain